MAIMKCPACGGQTDDRAPACPHCGRVTGAEAGVPAGSVICRKCGVLAPEGGTCPVCGERQSGTPPAAQNKRVSVLIAAAAIVLGLAVMIHSMLCATSGK